jgi:3-oxoacyl-[acyl-carrier protein] reductase
MLKQGRGVILATTSGAGLGAVAGLIAYGAAKAGIISLVRNLAVEFGGKGIRANAISPGAMDTPPLRAYIGSLPGGAERYVSQMPAGRLGTPEDIANVAVFLASDEASYVNGACLPIDGGTSALLAQPYTGA